MGCASIIGLDEYEEVDAPQTGVGGTSDGGTSGSGGNQSTTGGTAGDGGTTSGGGSVQSGGAGTGGAETGGTGGVADPCDQVDCDDGIGCTVDTCTDGTCDHATADLGDACPGGVCNGGSDAAACVPCMNDVVGETTDTGCTTSAPYCDTTGQAPVCVACVNDKAVDGNRDFGCPLGAPDCELQSGEWVCTGCGSAADCNDGDVCTTDSCQLGVCIHGTTGAGTICPDGVCNGVPGDEQCNSCFDDKGGTTTDTGCSVADPLCDTRGVDPVCVGCLDDKAGTTTDTGCSAGAKLCDETLATPECVVCVNDQTGTTADTGCSAAAKACDTSGTPACVACVDDQAGTGLDNGCSAGTPICKTGVTPTCVACVGDADCADADSCTWDVCNAGACQHLTERELIVDPSFEIQQVGAGVWTETSSVFATNIIVNESSPSTTDAYEGTYLAWMAGDKNDTARLSQLVVVPAGTQYLVANWWMDYAYTNQLDATEHAYVRLYNQPLSSVLTTFRTFDGNTSTGVVGWADWMNFQQVVAASAWQNQTIAFAVDTVTDGDNAIMHYFVDQVSLKARICPLP